MSSKSNSGTSLATKLGGRAGGRAKKKKAVREERESTWKMRCRFRNQIAEYFSRSGGRAGRSERRGTHVSPAAPYPDLPSGAFYLLQHRLQLWAFILHSEHTRTRYVLRFDTLATEVEMFSTRRVPLNGIPSSLCASFARPNCGIYGAHAPTRPPGARHWLLTPTANLMYFCRQSRRFGWKSTIAGSISSGDNYVRGHTWCC